METKDLIILNIRQWDREAKGSKELLTRMEIEKQKQKQKEIIWLNTWRQKGETEKCYWWSHMQKATLYSKQYFRHKKKKKSS